MAVIVTVTVTAELPWSFLSSLCSCAPEECKALLVVAGGDEGSTASLPGLLRAALVHAARALQEAALHETCVSAPLSLHACCVNGRSAV
jgi:hypothetical protein